MSRDPGRLAERMREVAMSPTMKGTIEAERLRRQGVDVVDLGAGEPDFATPRHVTEAAHAAITSNFTKYTANMGIADLREAVAARYRADYGVTYAADEVIITAGGKQALIHAFLRAAGPGDDVIRTAFGWPTLVCEQIKLAGARPVVVRTHEEEGFALRAERLLEAVTPRTRAILINSPGIRTGALLSETEARILASRGGAPGSVGRDRLVLRAADIRPRGAQPAEDLRGRHARSVGARGFDLQVLCDDGLALRIGWSGYEVLWSARRTRCRAILRLIVSSITQKAAVAALAGPQDCVRDMLREYRARRDQLLAWMGEEPHLVHGAAGCVLSVSVGRGVSPAGRVSDVASSLRMRSSRAKARRRATPE